MVNKTSQSHLVSPLCDVSLEDGLRALAQAHKFIVANAASELDSRRWKPTGSTETWGCDFKRIDIHLPNGHPDREFTDSAGWNHILIGEALQRQKLIEIINQAATLERLMDALRWTMSAGSGLSEYRIQLCHPTTSSEIKDDDAPDHDLVLSGPGGAALFEVSDVASSKDGNRKEKKDLRSLGLLVEGKGDEKFRVRDWPAGRLFLVVSAEWKKRLRKKSRRWVQNRTIGGTRVPPHLEMTLITWQSATGIFEIHRGKGFGRWLQPANNLTPTLREETE
jgi:hypothetical protein